MGNIDSPAGGKGGRPDGLGPFGKPSKGKPIESNQGDRAQANLPAGGKPSKKGPLSSPVDSWRGQIPSANQPDEPFRPAGG